MSYDFIPINNRFCDERIEDLVITDNYVALIGEISSYPYADLIIRPCNKDNVIASFFYSHRSTLIDEGYTEYVCCHMNGDTIALANMGETYVSGGSLGDIRIRMVELASMTMTGSQALGFTVFKPIPIDMVYVPEKSSLVLLANIIFPPSGSVNNHAFIYLDPYNTFSGGTTGSTTVGGSISPSPVPYMANGFCEWKYGLAFSSLDRINGEKAFLASGGDYWFLKDMTQMQSLVSCYWPDLVQVQKIDDLTPVIWGRPIPDCSEDFVITDVPTSVNSSAFSDICTIP